MAESTRGELVSKNFVFEMDKNGEMHFKGDFEGLYASEDDPWGQSGSDARMADYYEHSRTRILTTLSALAASGPLNILEIGCGLGHVANLIQSSNSLYRVTGLDISPLAIQKARAAFPHIDFMIGDITAQDFHAEKRFDVVILNQALWYVLQGLPQLFRNIGGLLPSGGHVLVVNAFMDDQKYGKEVIDGFDGLIKYVAHHLLGCGFSLVRADLDDSSGRIYKDGLVLLKKC